MQCIPSQLDVRQPAINIDPKNSKLEIDETSIGMRTMSVALGLFGLLIIAPSASISMVLAAGSLPLGYGLLERARARSALNAKAVDIFMKSTLVPEKVMSYLLDNPPAVRSLCQQPQVNLDKMDSITGMTLLDRSISGLSNCFSHKEVAYSVIQEIEVHGGLKKEKYQSLFLNSKLGPENAIFLLKEGKIKPEDFTEEQLVAFLKKVDDPEVLKAMVQHGFKLDIQEVLLSAIVNNKWDCVAFYLQRGVKIPDLQTCFLKNNSAMTFEAYLEKNPSSKKRIAQLQEKPPLTFPTIQHNVFAFWKPAIDVGGKYHHITVRDEAIALRTFLVAYPILCVAVGISAATLSFLPLLPVLPVAYFYHKWEWSRATKALNQIAIEQFRSSLPKSFVFEYFTNNNDDELIDRLHGDLTKLDEDGKELFHHFCKYRRSWDKQSFSAQFSIFRKIVDAIFSKELSVDQKYAYLLKAIKSGRPEFVSYLLAEGKIKAGELTEAQQFACFVKGVDSEILGVLCKQGFNIEAKDQYGNTPLLGLAQRRGYLSYYLHDFSVSQHVLALLSCGADAKATVNGKGILDLCDDKSLHKLIETQIKQ